MDICGNNFGGRERKREVSVVKGYASTPTHTSRHYNHTCPIEVKMVTTLSIVAALSFLGRQKEAIKFLYTPRGLKSCHILYRMMGVPSSGVMYGLMMVARPSLCTPWFTSYEEVVTFARHSKWLHSLLEERYRSEIKKMLAGDQHTATFELTNVQTRGKIY